MASTAGASNEGALPSESGSGEHPVLPVANQPLLIAGIMLASVLPLLDTTIANVAIPHMQAALGATPESVMWVLTSYIIAHAVAMPLTGWLSDRIGSRELFIITTVAFVAASMLCGTARSLEEMVVYRSLQGLAGAFILPLSQSSMLDTSKPSQHAQMMAIWGLGAVLGPIFGPLIGGWLTENWNWRWVFFVNLPLGLIAIAILFFTLPGHAKKKRQFDLFGFAMIATFLASLQLLLDRGHHIDWFDSRESWIYLVICLSALWVAIIHLRTCPNPVYPRALFRDVNLMVAIGLMALISLVIYSTMALLPPMLQNLFGYSVMDTGMVLAPRGVGVMIGMQIAQRMLKRGMDARIPIAIGFALTIWSLHDMTLWSLETSEFDLIWVGVIQGLGVGFISLPLFVIAFMTLSPSQRTDGSGLLNLSRLVASSIGISIVTAIFARNIQINHADLAAHIKQPMMSMIDLATTHSMPELTEFFVYLADVEINRQAAMIAYLNDFYLLFWASVITAPLLIFVRKLPPRNLG